MLKQPALTELCLQTVMETHALKVSLLIQPRTVLVCCFLLLLCLIYLLPSIIFGTVKDVQFYNYD